MRIWIFNQYAVTPDLPGGTRHYDFARELIRRGHSVTIFTSSFHYSLLRETKEYKKGNYIIEEKDGVTVVWVKTISYCKNDWRRVVNMLSYSSKVYKLAMKNEFDKPDVIIGSSVHLFAVYAAYLLSKHLDARFIMEIRDLWPQTLIDMGVCKWHPIVIILGILERFLYRRAHRVITLLPKADEYLFLRGVPSDKITWISNGVMMRRIVNDDIETIIKKKLGDEFTVTYAGAIGRANHLDIAIDAAEIMQTDYSQIKFKFLFVGDGTEKKRLAEMVKGKKLRNVDFTEQVPKNEVVKILRNSDALYFNLKDSPVFRYGISSNKLFDYLATGKPIIFSCNSVNNPVEEAKAGITVSPNNPQALVEVIIYLTQMSDQEREELGGNGRKYVETFYSISALTDKLENLIKATISHKNSS